MDDITPLNLEDCPKLFGLRYDQLIGILASLIISTQFYSWCNPINFAGQDFRELAIGQSGLDLDRAQPVAVSFRDPDVVF